MKKAFIYRNINYVFSLVILTFLFPFTSLNAENNGLFKEDKCKNAYLYHFMNRSCYYGDEIGVRILLSQGADPNGKDYDNYPDCVAPIEFSSPLYSAVSGNHIEVVTILLKSGADPNILEGEGVTPLVEAVRIENVEIVKLLLKHGAKVNMNGLYYKPLDIAKQKGNRKIIELLERD